MSPNWSSFSATGRIMENMASATPSKPLSSGNNINASHIDLESRIEKQSLLIQTLLMILIEKKVIQEDEFKEWMIYVDELDGKRDGKLREDKSPIVCPKCKRNNAKNRANCQYCGEEFPPEFLMHMKNA